MRKNEEQKIINEIKQAITDLRNLYNDKANGGDFRTANQLEGILVRLMLTDARIMFLEQGLTLDEGSIMGTEKFLKHLREENGVSWQTLEEKRFKLESEDE